MAHAERIFLGDQSDEPRPHLKGVSAAPRPTWCAQLAERDLAVLRLLAEGESTARIANELAYSESTIKNVIHDLVRQIGARNRAHAVAMAIRGGAI